MKDDRSTGLRLLNSLLRALDREGVSVSIDGRAARTLVAHVADYGVSFTLDAISKAPAHSTPQKGASDFFGFTSCRRAAEPRQSNPGTTPTTQQLETPNSGC
jgi:hypothetical protein